MLIGCTCNTTVSKPSKIFCLGESTYVSILENLGKVPKGLEELGAEDLVQDMLIGCTCNTTHGLPKHCGHLIHSKRSISTHHEVHRLLRMSK